MKEEHLPVYLSLILCFPRSRLERTWQISSVSTVHKSPAKCQSVPAKAVLAAAAAEEAPGCQGVLGPLGLIETSLG